MNHSGLPVAVLLYNVAPNVGHWACRLGSESNKTLYYLMLGLMLQRHTGDTFHTAHYLRGGAREVTPLQNAVATEVRGGQEHLGTRKLQEAPLLHLQHQSFILLP